jgi:DNA excision repair protein ERCC-5
MDPEEVEVDADDAGQSEEEYREPTKSKGKGTAKWKRTKV